MKEYQDDLCDFCGTECYCVKEEKTEEKEHDVWLNTFCPEDECLNKTGTELI